MKVLVIVLCIVLFIIASCGDKQENWVICPAGYIQTSEQTYNLHTWYEYDGKLIISSADMVTIELLAYDTYSYMGKDYLFELVWNGDIVCIKRGE